MKIACRGVASVAPPPPRAALDPFPCFLVLCGKGGGGCVWILAPHADGFYTLRLTPYTLRPTPYTLHPTLYILHPTSYTLHPTPYTLHPTPCTLHTTHYTLHPAPYTLHPTPNKLHPTPCTLHPTPCTLHPTPYTLHAGRWAGKLQACPIQTNQRIWGQRFFFQNLTTKYTTQLSPSSNVKTFWQQFYLQDSDRKSRFPWITPFL